MWEEIWEVRAELQNRLTQLENRYEEKFPLNFTAKSVTDTEALLEIKIKNAPLISSSLPYVIKGELRQIKGWLIPTLDALLRD